MDIIRNQIIEPDCFYHVYNRGINGGNIFLNTDNYHFFLNKFSKYLNSVCNVYSYCLMPNHFHFLVKIKSKEELIHFVNSEIKINDEIKNGLHSFESIFSKQTAKFLSSYTQALNKVSNRHGALLESPFKRIKIDSEDYLKNLIIYIHQNPTSLDLDFRTYVFSSYKAIISTNQTNIKRKEVIDLFNDLENFKFVHQKELNFSEKFITL